MSEDLLTIYVDGAARGNPGPAAFAYVIATPGREPVEHAERLGTATNNVAEYTALVRALERARELAARRLAIFSDSELMVKQMNGEYRVKNPELKEFYDEARALVRHFAGVTLTHVRRSENKRADQLCNAVLDGKFRAPADGQPAPKKAPAVSGKAVRRASVDEEAVECLRNAAAAWARGDSTNPQPTMVWQQLWSILEGGGVLRTKKAK